MQLTRHQGGQINAVLNSAHIAYVFALGKEVGSRRAFEPTSAPGADQPIDLAP